MNSILSSYKNLHDNLKKRDLYKFFTYKYFIGSTFNSNNPPLFYFKNSDNKFFNHYNMLEYKLLIRYISKKYNLSKINSILNYNDIDNINKLSIF